MKRSSFIYCIALVSGIILISQTGCKKTENPIKFPLGIFPDTVKNIQNINSAFDDYNVSLYHIYADVPIIFSSNRSSSGGQFDLEQAAISFVFDQTNGNFEFTAAMTDDAFLGKLVDAAKTPGDDFGPYRLWSPLDGFEYLVLTSENVSGDLDLFYFKNRPAYNNNLPAIEGPFPVKLLNTINNDAYICFDSNLDSAYFVSDIDGNFDIFVHQRPENEKIDTWFDRDYAASAKVDSINSSSDDKCPVIFRKVMIFASDRPGGLGGFDLYYSVFRNGNWNTPVNMGPGINTSSNEYRPVVGYHPEFKNQFLMFSSDRSGGQGGFDLYFTGIDLPEK